MTTAASCEDDEDVDDFDVDIDDDEGEDAASCSHLSSWMHVPTTNPFATHIFAQPLLNLTCR